MAGRDNFRNLVAQGMAEKVKSICSKLIRIPRVFAASQVGYIRTAT